MMDKQTIADIRDTLGRMKAVRQLAKEEGNAAYDYREFEELGYKIEAYAEEWLTELLAEYDTNEAIAQRIGEVIGSVDSRNR